VTASVGLTLLDDHGDSDDDLLVAADLAMYEAKRGGRNRVAIHDANRPHTRGGRLTRAERIREALDNDGFVLHFQPILDLATDRVTTYEALIRMRDSESGELVQPGAFLYVADRYGMAYSIDRWVIGRAIKTLASGRLGDDARLAINISARTLNHPEVLDELGRRLEDASIEPGRLILEITETAAIENVENAKRFARRLTSLGCALALDDFGTGFSSFYYLKHLPCQYLKIDGEFIRNLRASPNDRLLVKSVVDIAKGMGKRTIAEFVGDEETVAILTGIGVDYAQGFHVGKPAPAGEIAQGAGAVHSQ
jgi:EAL domain-containing protein (putative c-di-GMP-specific phosphodiesterase class I)